MIVALTAAFFSFADEKMPSVQEYIDQANKQRKTALEKAERELKEAAANPKSKTSKKSRRRFLSKAQNDLATLKLVRDGLRSGKLLPTPQLDLGALEVGRIGAIEFDGWIRSVQTDSIVVEFERGNGEGKKKSSKKPGAAPTTVVIGGLKPMPKEAGVEFSSPEVFAIVGTVEVEGTSRPLLKPYPHAGKAIIQWEEEWEQVAVKKKQPKIPDPTVPPK